jgi:hypothetical protein
MAPRSRPTPRQGALGEFSIAAWRSYCKEHVQPETPQQAARLRRLLEYPEALEAWANLARDARLGEVRITLEQFARLRCSERIVDWREFLVSVIKVLIFPPDPPLTPSVRYYRAIGRAFQKILEIERQYPDVLFEIELAASVAGLAQSGTLMTLT